MIPDGLIYRSALSSEGFFISCTVVTCLLAQFLILTPELSRQKAEMTQASGIRITYITSNFHAATQINS